MTPNPFNSHATKPGAIPYQYQANVTEDSNAAIRQQTIDRVLQTLKTSRLAQVVGPHGSGKSTLLADWASSLEHGFPGGAWIQLTREPQQRWLGRLRDSFLQCRMVWNVQTKANREGIIVIDGGEQLWWLIRVTIRVRTRLHRQVCLITSHRPLAGFAIVYETSIDPEVVCQLASRLLGDPSHPLLQRIDDHPIDDVRQLWSRLYDLFATESIRNRNKVC